MKRAIAFLNLIALASPSIALAQVDPASAGQKTLAATMNVYAFPTKGQAAAQQSEDEAACYTFAVQQTGVDPFSLQKQAQAQAQHTEAAKQQAQQAGAGAGAAGAVKGAAAGALIGSVSHGSTSGEGAAVGAVAGLLLGHRRKREAQEQATQQAEQQGQQAQAATAQQSDNFKKAFSVCLEAKSYMVKY
jgi:uncharacterized protein YcfJ